ncbi:reverse transcriptase [Plakobranchus ocellatus]|uniref:Reverse transcriptase n=1 Tax=Plakobranchus ocellatus TaxID=259542 RepID=A0AAV3ZZB8_9GAST|nr:reverse transcriptase [Plakobranchus ocellatus]
MAVSPLIEDADIWTAQLLSPDDNIVAQVAPYQLRDTIISSLAHNLQPDDDIPDTVFLSGDNSSGMYSFRHHIWTQARHAASQRPTEPAAPSTRGVTGECPDPQASRQPPTAGRAEDDDRAIPDLTVKLRTERIFIFVTVLFIKLANLYRTGQEKRDKYGHLGTVPSLVVGALGSGFPENEAIRASLNIPHRKWNVARLRIRASAIEDSCCLASSFFKFNL